MEGLALIRKAKQGEREDKLFQMWVAQLPFMTQDTFIGFTDYRDRLTGANIDTRSTTEILADLAGVEAEFQQKGGDKNGNGDL